MRLPARQVFVMAEVATLLFEESPVMFAKFLRANQYPRKHTVEQSVVDKCASLGISGETSSGGSVGVTLLPATTVEALRPRAHVVSGTGTGAARMRAASTAAGSTGCQRYVPRSHERGPSAASRSAARGASAAASPTGRATTASSSKGGGSTKPCATK